MFKLQTMKITISTAYQVTEKTISEEILKHFICFQERPFWRTNLWNLPKRRVSLAENC